MGIIKAIRQTVIGKTEDEKAVDAAYADLLGVLKAHFGPDPEGSYKYSFSGDCADINYGILNRLRSDNWTVGTPDMLLSTSPTIVEVEISNPPKGFVRSL